MSDFLRFRKKKKSPKGPTTYKVTIPAFTKHIDGFTDHEGHIFDDQIVNIPASTFPLTIPWTDEYDGGVEFETPPTKVTMTAPPHAGYGNTKIWVRGMRYVYYPHALPGQHVPHHLVEEANLPAFSQLEHRGQGAELPLDKMPRTAEVMEELVRTGRKRSSSGNSAIDFITGRGRSGSAGSSSSIRDVLPNVIERIRRVSTSSGGRRGSKSRPVLPDEPIHRPMIAVPMMTRNFYEHDHWNHPFAKDIDLLRDKFTSGLILLGSDPVKATITLSYFGGTPGQENGESGRYFNAVVPPHSFMAPSHRIHHPTRSIIKVFVPDYVLNADKYRPYTFQLPADEEGNPGVWARFWPLPNLDQQVAKKYWWRSSVLAEEYRLELVSSEKPAEMDGNGNIVSAYKPPKDDGKEWWEPPKKSPGQPRVPKNRPSEDDLVLDSTSEFGQQNPLLLPIHEQLGLTVRVMKDRVFKTLKNLTGTGNVLMQDDEWFSYLMLQQDIEVLLGLGDDQYISGSGMSAFLQMLTLQYGGIALNPEICQMLYINPSEPFEHFKDILPKSPLFANRRKWIVIPININLNHWIMCMMDNEKKTIGFYDSLGTGKVLDANAFSKYTTRLVGLLKYIHQKEMGKPMPTYGPARQVVVPQQNNMVDCGAYSCAFAECLIRGIPFSTLKKDYMALYRYKMAYCIVSAHDSMN